MTLPAFSGGEAFVKKPWGGYKVLSRFQIGKEQYLVKLITIKPGQSTSIQYHRFRNEKWLWVSGKVEVSKTGSVFARVGRSRDCILAEVDENLCYLQDKGSMSIGRHEIHMMQCPAGAPAPGILLEVQHGSRCSEDDIYRIFDPYRRN